MRSNSGASRISADAAPTRLAATTSAARGAVRVVPNGALGDLDETALAKQLGQVGIMTGRGVEQTAAGVTLIDDSFNGNPASVAATCGPCPVVVQR